MPDAERRLEAATDDAMTAVIAWQKEAREAPWTSPSRNQVRETIRAQFDRAERAEARLDEIRSTLDTYFVVHGNNTAASLTRARDLAEGIRQILDREPKL